MHFRPADISAILGLSGQATLIGLSESCKNGLPVASLDALAECFRPHEQAFLDSLFSKSTLRRRRKLGRLSPEESDRLVRLAATWLMARYTFGNRGKAQRFLTTEHPLLDGRRPLDLTKANTAGTAAVEQLLGRLKYGSAA